jgi:two-component system chemotaxis sensor kinase CheA
MCNKQVRLDMEGKETELDRTIIEAIKDPLTHIVRNSVDHGIESPSDRVKAGKPAEGRLLVKAFHEGGQVIIEIEDDGGGINTEKVRAKAIQNGIITAEAAARMGERELINMIFAPGFSTADKVSNISGRGVGMDVVKTNIEKIGGSVDVQSLLGKGTTLKIKIPLTLAIIPALIVTSGGDRYAIPQVNLLELVRLEGEQARKGIETIQGCPVYRLRGNLLPLLYLNRELKLEPVNTQTVDDQTINIVVLRADDHHFGLVVDTICDTEEIVVKPLSKQLKGVTAFAGATIMGDGQVALILDVLGLAQRASVLGQAREKAKAAATGDHAGTGETRRTLLLFSAGQNSRLAIPLSEVARLEEFPASAIEHTGPQDVVQYRGEIMPLVHLNGLLEPGTTHTVSNNSNLQVVVYARDSRYVGLVVGKILDIVDANVVVKRSASRVGTLGSLVVQDRVTELLDIDTVLASADGRAA